MSVAMMGSGGGGGSKSAFFELRSAIENDLSSKLNTFEKTVWNKQDSTTDGSLSFKFTDNTGVVKNTGTGNKYIYARCYQAGANSGRIRFTTGFDSASDSNDCIDIFDVGIEKTYNNSNTSTTKLWEAIFRVSPGATVTILFEGGQYTSYSMSFKWIKDS